MAYIKRMNGMNNSDQQNKAKALNQISGGESGMLSPNSEPGNAQQKPSDSGQGWTNAQDYIEANKGQIGGLTDKMGQYMGDQGQEASDANKNWYDYNQKSIDDGTSKIDENLLNNALENPESVAMLSGGGKIPGGTPWQHWLNMNKGYTGVTDVTKKGDYDLLQKELGDVGEIEGLNKSEGGTRQLVSKIMQNPTGGKLGFNALLMQDPTAKAELSAANQALSDIQSSYENNYNTLLNNIGNAQNISTQNQNRIQDSVQGKIDEYTMGYNPNPIHGRSDYNNAMDDYNKYQAYNQLIGGTAELAEPTYVQTHSVKPGQPGGPQLTPTPVDPTPYIDTNVKPDLSDLPEGPKQGSRVYQDMNGEWHVIR